MNVQLIKSLVEKLNFKFPYSVEEYCENPLMENYHYHSSFSNTSVADSPTNNDEYAKRIKEYGYKCIFSGEHGSIGNQFEVYTLSEKFNLEYRHSSEVYWVKDRHEKDNANCHMCIVATNDEGRKDLNYILSIANEDGYYYRPRIDLELLFSVNPKNFVVTSACVAGWKYEDAEEQWLKVWEYFGDNFFLEIQIHNTPKQKILNRRVLDFAHKYGIPIICGLDSHYIDESDDIKREKILEYKNTKYGDEEGWYMDFPDTETVYRRLVEQGILTEEEIWECILNTMVFASDKFEKIVFDRHFKIPNVYPGTTYEERVKIFHNILNEEYKKEKLKSKERIKGIQYEAEQITDSGVVDYFLTNRVILKEAIENEGGVLTTTSRGSMASFYVNKLLGFTTVDRFTAEVPIYPERFLTKERVQSGQMPDCDYNVSSQEPFLKASRTIIGPHGCYPLMAIEKLKEKAAWQLYASVAGVEPSVANEVSKFIDKYNDKLKYADEEDKQYIDIEEFIPAEYLPIYKESLAYQGIVSNLKVHACGHLLLDGDIRREIGLISAVSETTGNRTLCACIEGGYLDAFGFVKNDYLIVDSVGLIKECWDSIGQEVPTFDELRELIREDELTWDIYARGITCCVNQMEKESTTGKAMRYRPQNLAESSSLIAGIRPGFKSLIENFLARKPYTTGEPKIDEVLEDTFHYMIYQESIMKVLAFLGQSMSETYVVIKNISKKKYSEHPEMLKELQEQLKEGWLKQIGNLDNFDRVWQVIYDAGRYSFNAPHALSMGGDSAYLAWFKAHYPAKFYEVAINHYQKKNKKDKIEVLIKEIIQFFGYSLGNLTFGMDNRQVIVSEESKKIYPTMVGIKDMQKIAPEVLFDMSHKDYKDINFIFADMLNNGLNKTSLDILIRLDYFWEYGDIHWVQCALEIYKETAEIMDKLRNCKQLTKDKVPSYGLLLDEVKKFFKVETAKIIKEVDIEAFSNYVNRNYRRIMDAVALTKSYIPATIEDKIKYQVQILGHCDIIDPSIPDNLYVLCEVEFNRYGTPFFILYNPHCGTTEKYKVDKKWFREYTLTTENDSGSFLKCAFKEKEKRVKVMNPDTGKEKWTGTGEYETILDVYKIEY